MVTDTRAVTAHLRAFDKHPKADAFIHSAAKRKIARSGRRGAKTTAAARVALDAFISGRRVLYAVPTENQLDAFWFEIRRALQEPVDWGMYVKNESSHYIERRNTRQRIRGKTAYDADTLRGDYADLLIMDEIQHMHRTAWEDVGQPMLADHDGDAVFLYTPLSPVSAARHRTLDPHFAKDLWNEAVLNRSGMWETFSWTSYDNGYISREALERIASDMRQASYRREILAEELDEIEGAMWKRATLEQHRLMEHPELSRIVIGVDPPGGAVECGIIAAGVGICPCNGKEERHGFVLDDKSVQASPDTWAKAVLTAYWGYQADRIVGEANYGGDMVEHTIRTAAQGAIISYKNVSATRGKALRAEPIAALYEQGKVHHVGSLWGLEDELCTWLPGQGGPSPNRLDALVWALTELMITGGIPNLRFIG